MIEFLTVLAIFLGGCALMRVVGFTGWALPAFGLVTGVALMVGIGLIQLVTPYAPTTPLATEVLTLAMPTAWWLWAWRRGHDVTVAPVLAGLCVVGLAVAVWILRMADLVALHSDSVTYLMAGRMIANETYKSDISTYSVTNRAAGVPLIHAPAYLSGEYYLRSISPLLAMAMLACLVWFFRRGSQRLTVTSATSATALCVVGVLLLITNRFIFNAFYLNGHLFQAALVMFVVAAGWLALTRAQVPPAAPLALQLVAVPGLIATRAGGILAAVVAFLPTWVGLRSPNHRSATLVAVGAFDVAWYGFQTWVYLGRGSAVPVSLLGPLLLGLGLVAVATLPLWSLVTRRPAAWLWTVEIGLWVVLVGFAIRDLDLLRASVRGTYRNLVDGVGLWGLSIIILGLLLVLTLFWFRFDYQWSLRFPVKTFVPLAFVLAYVRGGAYHAAYGDSLNRIWMPILPIAVLLLIVAIASANERLARLAAESTDPLSGGGFPSETSPQATKPYIPGPSSNTVTAQHPGGG